MQRGEMNVVVELYVVDTNVVLPLQMAAGGVLERTCNFDG